MECKEIKEILDLYPIESLPRKEAESIKEHLAICKNCEKAYEEIKKIEELMALKPAVAPRPEIKTLILKAIKEELKAISFPQRIRWGFSLSGAVAAAVIAVTLSLVLPYEKALKICDSDFFKNNLMPYTPEGIVYSFLGAVYGIVPVFLSSLFVGRAFQKNRVLNGLLMGLTFSIIMVPYVVVQCESFTIGLTAAWLLGTIIGGTSGALSGTLIMARGEENI